jgi:hypothetical protein
LLWFADVSALTYKSNKINKKILRKKGKI